jgi:hypothetical protein
VSLIPHAEHIARSYPFEILANLTLLTAARARACSGKVPRACSAWGARATQAVAWRRKATRACTVGAHGSVWVHQLWRGGVRVAWACSARGARVRGAADARLWSGRHARSSLILGEI